MTLQGVLYRAKAPLRISFAGGGTDVSPFVDREGGCVLSATINRYAHGALRPRRDRSVKIQALDFNISVAYEVDQAPPYDGKLDLAKAAIRRICPDLGSGLDLYLHADVPPGSGLGSSSTMVVTLVALLKEHLNLPLTEYEIADLAYQIERVELGIKGGYQDQYAAAFGGFNFIEFEGGRATVNPLRIKADIINELEANLMLVYAGAPRLSAHIIDDQVARYERGEQQSVENLRKIKALTYEMKDALLTGRLTRFAELLHEEWMAKRMLSPKIATDYLDEIYETARKLGAIGGKLSGAGGGGFMQLYCPFDRKHRIAERLKEMGCTVSDVAFTQQGVQTWVVRQ
ncbi:D-glycero-alpha-D-manno-heptose 7-phosphate kinase [bacterium HR33]|nr:D-glycero-alpha-D-manno-heptose 7-phosphate kinase [bacterium HR33]